MCVFTGIVQKHVWLIMKHWKALKTRFLKIKQIGIKHCHTERSDLESSAKKLKEKQRIKY